MNELEENERKLRRINEKLDEEASKVLTNIKFSTLPFPKSQKIEKYSITRREKFTNFETRNKDATTNKETPSSLREKTPSPTKNFVNINTVSCKQNIPDKDNMSPSSSSSSLQKKPAPVNKTNNLNADKNLKFLKTKVTILQDELENRSIEMTKKIEELELCVEKQKKIEIERNQMNLKNHSLMEQIKKYEEKLLQTEIKLKERDKELLSQNRELEDFRREIKLLNQSNSNLEKRLLKANEENEKLKQSLNLQKNIERELKENTRKDKEILMRQIQKLKKQKQELFAAYKKQLFLIDNLKRQIVCLEQTRMIALAANDFTQVLEWNKKN